jgi:hypothetical protein
MRVWVLESPRSITQAIYYAMCGFAIPALVPYQFHVSCFTAPTDSNQVGHFFCVHFVPGMFLGP